MRKFKKNSPKRQSVFLAFLVSILAIITVITVIKISKIGLKPIAPTVPKKVPAREEPDPACVLSFLVLSPTPTLVSIVTPSVSLTPTPEPTSPVIPTSTFTPTPTLPSCTDKGGYCRSSAPAACRTLRCGGGEDPNYCVERTVTATFGPNEVRDCGHSDGKTCYVYSCSEKQCSSGCDTTNCTCRPTPIPTIGCENCVGGTQHAYPPEIWDLNHNGQIDDCPEACRAFYGGSCNGNSYCSHPGSTNPAVCCTCVTSLGVSCDSL